MPQKLISFILIIWIFEKMISIHKTAIIDFPKNLLHIFI